MDGSMESILISACILILTIAVTYIGIHWNYSGVRKYSASEYDDKVKEVFLRKFESAKVISKHDSDLTVRD